MELFNIAPIGLNQTEQIDTARLKFSEVSMGKHIRTWSFYGGGAFVSPVLVIALHTSESKRLYQTNKISFYYTHKIKAMHIQIIFEFV